MDHSTAIQDAAGQAVGADLGSKPYLDRREAAAYLTALGLTTAPSTLAKLATLGGGPVISYFGRKRPRYTPADLRTWADAKLIRRRSTSDQGGDHAAA